MSVENNHTSQNNRLPDITEGVTNTPENDYHDIGSSDFIRK